MTKLVFLPFLILLLLSSLVFAATESSVGVTVTWRQAACNDGIDNDGDFSVDYSSDSQCSSAVDDDENVTGTQVHATQDFTISGGSFSFNNSDGLAVDFSFPSNFYTESVRLFANSYANGFFDTDKPAPSGKSFVGKTYDFLLYVVSSGSSLSSVNSAVTITVRYNNSDVGSLQESGFRAYRWGVSDSSWQEISSSAVDTSNNTVTFSATSFGSFALFGSSPPAETPSSGGGAAQPGSFSGYLPQIPRVPRPKTPPPAFVDFNGDGKADIADLSILLYWWSRTGEDIRPYDLNRDGTIDIVDASVLLYYWSE